jgi:hypothetical protein
MRPIPGKCASFVTSALLLVLAPALASAAVGTPVPVSVAGFTCPPSTVTPFPSQTNFPSAEVEPWVAMNPHDPGSLIAVWQQDRWSSLGANGLVGGYTTNGGATWTQTSATFSHCTGGTAGNGGDYDRATDPWVTIAPDGTAYFLSISLQVPGTRHEMAVARSTNGGATWSGPVALRRDTALTVANDKGTITADPANANNVYAVWVRYLFPNEKARGQAGNHSAGYYGPTWFARTTNGGASWEPARQIFDPANEGPGQGRNDETQFNQIFVLPDGTLVNAFVLIHNDNAHHRRGVKVALIRSFDKGATWERHATIIDGQAPVGVTDPTTGEPLRTGGPMMAVDRSANPLTRGNLYAVWEDGRFSGGHHDEIAFTRSTDGGSTWSQPKRISTPSGKPAFTPTIAVSDTGTVGVVYYDLRHDGSGAPLPTDLWMVTSSNGGATWSEQHVSGPFDMRNAPFGSGGYFVGDYIGLTAGGSAFHPVWIEATAADNVTDVYTSTVTP